MQTGDSCELRLLTADLAGKPDMSPGERAIPYSEIFHRYRPDILGLQSVTERFWQSDLFPLLSDAFRPVCTGGKVEMATPLFYRKDRFRLIDSGSLLFHEKLNAEKGYTFGVFREDKSDGQLFAVMSTAFYEGNSPEGAYIREVNATRLCTEAAQLYRSYDCPVLLLGHFGPDGNGTELFHRLTFAGGPALGRLPAMAAVPATAGENTSDECQPKKEIETSHGMPDGVSTECGFYFLGKLTPKAYRMVTDQDAGSVADRLPLCLDVCL